MSQQVCVGCVVVHSTAHSYTPLMSLLPFLPCQTHYHYASRFYVVYGMSLLWQAVTGASLGLSWPPCREFWRLSQLAGNSKAWPSATGRNQATHVVSCMPCDGWRLLLCRKKPLVLDLCLAVPVSTYSIVLTAQFTKAFLMMLEHPPDAHRGFDVPPVIITVGCAAVAPCGGSGNASDCSAGNAVCSCAGSDDACASPVSWQVVQAAGSESARGLDQVTPLMWQLKQTRPCQVCGPMAGQHGVPQHYQPLITHICRSSSSRKSTLVGAVLVLRALLPAIGHCLPSWQYYPMVGLSGAACCVVMKPLDRGRDTGHYQSGCWALRRSRRVIWCSCKF